MNPSLQRALEGALGCTVAEVERIAGGDINDAYLLTLRDGGRLFVKTRPDAPTDMYEREAEGLSWLAEARALPTPVVRLVRADCLVLDFIGRANRCADFDERFGRGLAALHRFGADRFGLARDNYIANLPQANDACATFAAFYRERRLGPLGERAQRAGLLDARDGRPLAQLCARLDELVPDEPPARLHGDLWSGNIFVASDGGPMLIDPAVYGGQRELDLAMLQLFGAPSERFFAAYDEVYPRAPGHRERVALWQLYPLLVHVCLLGGGYVSQFRTALARYA